MLEQPANESPVHNVVAMNKESYWLTLTLLHLEARPRPRDCSMFCIEKCKQLGIMVSSKAASLRMYIENVNICVHSLLYFLMPRSHIADWTLD